MRTRRCRVFSGEIVPCVVVGGLCEVAVQCYFGTDDRAIPGVCYGCTVCRGWSFSCSVERRNGGRAEGGTSGTAGASAGSAGRGGLASSAGSGGKSSTGGHPQMGEGGFASQDAGAGGELPIGAAGQASGGSNSDSSGGDESGGSGARGGVVGSGGNLSVGSSGGGGTSGGGASAGATGSGGAGDSTAPSVVSITPTNLAAGVTSNTTLKITFSEPMNTSSVAGALTVTSFASGSLGLSWDSTGRVLTITPSGGLQYATGSSPGTTTPTTYSVSLTTGARDLAGNSLGPFSSSFSTLRRITMSLASDIQAYYDTYARSQGGAPVMCTGLAPVEVAEWVGPSASGTTYGFISFDTTPLGSPADITAIESATLVGTQSRPTGDFYAKHAVVATKLQYHAFDKDLLSAAVTDSLGNFCILASTAEPSISVLASFKPDIASGNQHQLYRLEATGSKDDTSAFFTCAFSLKVTFLSP